MIVFYVLHLYIKSQIYFNVHFFCYFEVETFFALFIVLVLIFSILFNLVNLFWLNHQKNSIRFDFFYSVQPHDTTINQVHGSFLTEISTVLNNSYMWNVFNKVYVKLLNIYSHMNTRSKLKLKLFGNIIKR